MGTEQSLLHLKATLKKKEVKIVCHSCSNIFELTEEHPSWTFPSGQIIRFCTLEEKNTFLTEHNLN